MGGGTAVGSIVISPIESDQSGVAVELRGDMDAAAAGALRRIFVQMILQQRPTRILVDLREVTVLDALVIGTLQAAGDLARDAHLAFTFEGSTRWRRIT
jgi:anti-anti-sigma factor